MHHATLCYVFDYSNPKDVRLLLGMKKRNFGAGNLNGYGGKVEPSDAGYEAATIREVREEAKIEVSNLEKVAEIEFKFTNAPAGKDWDQIVHVYFTKSWEGEPVETEEMSPWWCSVKHINVLYDKFWETDRHWFPEVLKGKKIYAWFTFAEDNKSVKDYRIEETADFKR